MRASLEYTSSVVGVRAPLGAGALLEAAYLLYYCIKTMTACSEQTDHAEERVMLRRSGLRYFYGNLELGSFEIRCN